MNTNNMKGLLHGLLPAALMSVSVGQIYAFSNYSTDVANYIGCSQGIVQWGFSLGIFFLGMGAAFFGKLVEKDIKLSALIGMGLFILGMVASQFSILKHSSLGFLFSYGALIGLGTGIIYITPVKTMMMWFPKYKAVASAVPIIFFGLGSTLATFLYGNFIPFGIERLFFNYAIFYVLPLALGSAFLMKPEVEDKTIATGSSDFSYVKLLKEPFFRMSWLFMLLNISAGLSLIPLSKQIMMNDIGYSLGTVTAFLALAGVFNGGGRLIYAYVADRLKTRLNIIAAILIDSMIAIILCMLFPKIFGISLLIINMCYGAGFSVIPSILSDRFGMSDLSKIHGAVLSAWGISGLIGNNVSLLVGNHFGVMGVFSMMLCVYFINLMNWCEMRNENKIRS